MSNTLEVKFSSEVGREKFRSELDSAQSGQLNLQEWHIKPFLIFTDIWKLWQRRCLLMRHTQRKLAWSLLKETRSSNSISRQKIDGNLQVIFI